MMRRKLHSLLRLQGWELSILLEACLLLPLVALGLRFWGFRFVVRALMLERGEGVQRKQDLAQAEGIAMLVAKIAANLPFHSSCLVRALSSARILQNRALYADLLIGVRKDESRGIMAHAWLELAGQPLAERTDITSLYASFPSSELKLKYFI